MESGQNRCSGRFGGVFFLAFGVSAALASSMGCRIRLRAFINLENQSVQTVAPIRTLLPAPLSRWTVPRSPVVDLQQRQVRLCGNLLLLILCGIRVLVWCATFRTGYLSQQRC